jgi:glycerophosphoryl diester phosphodiesterase
MQRYRTSFFVLAFAVLFETANTAQAQEPASMLTPSRGSPIVIAHRGASGYRPEHTLEAYRLAIEMGADFIEPDLVATQDGQLVARHEPDITLTTDVAQRPEFATRKRRTTIDGVIYEGWFTVDFTLAELKTLRAVQPRADRSKAFDGRYEIPTLAEIIALAKSESARLGRTIGIYPETKHPTWHCALGLPLEPPLLEALAAAGWQDVTAPVFIQSFESGNLQWLHERTAVPLVQLIAGAGLRDDGSVIPSPMLSQEKPCPLYPVGALPNDFSSLAAFEQIATYASGIGPWKRWIVGAQQSADRSHWTAASATDFIKLAHAAGLLVHPWTFRNETTELLKDYAGDPLNEYRAFYALGVDGVFSDFPDTARLALEAQ